MRSSSLSLLPILILFLAGTAAGQGITEIELGDQLKGDVSGDDPVVVPFLGLAGSLATFQLSTDAGAFPDLRVLLPDRSELDIAALKKPDKKGRKLTVKKLPLPVTGRYFLLVTTQVPSDFSLKTSAKVQKKVKKTVVIPALAVHEERIPAPPGTVLTVSIKAGKGSALLPLILDILDPQGNPVNLAFGRRKTKDTSDSISKLPLGTIGDNTGFGEYIVRFGVREGGVGDIGTFQVKARLPKPRKAKIDLATLRVNPFVDSVSLRSVFDNQEFKGVFVQGSFFQEGAVLVLEQLDPDTGLPTGVKIAPTTQSRPTPSLILADFDFNDVPVGDFDVVVRNPDGTFASLALAEGDEAPPLRIIRAPRATRLSPSLVFDGDEYNQWPMSVIGDSFKTAPDVPTLTLIPVSVEELRPGAQVLPGSVVVTAGGTRIDFEVNAWQKDLGTYEIVVKNADGGQTRVPGTFRIKVAPLATSIDVTSAFDNERKTITLTGDKLLRTPEVQLIHSVSGAVIEATSETWQSATTMTFTVAFSGARAGVWDLKVTNPRAAPEDLFQGFDILEDALEVYKAPILVAPDPVRGFTGETFNPFTILGDNFQTAPAVRLVGASQVVVPTNIQQVDATKITSELDLTGVEGGAFALEVTNTSGGGKATRVDAFHVLGPFGLVTDATGNTGASEPAVVHNPDRDEYFVVCTYTDSAGNKDIRGYRLDAETGVPVGGEIKITETPGTDEEQPHAAYDPEGDRYLVVYISGGTEVAAREVSPTGSLGTLLSLAKDSDSRAHPRVTYNGNADEFFVVYERKDSSWDVEAARVPTSGGLSQSSVRSFGIAWSSWPEIEPDVVYDPSYGVYVIVYAEDIVPPDEGDPADDTRYDVTVVHVDGSGTQPIASTSDLVAGELDDERRPRIARRPDALSPELLIVWERRLTGETDLYGRRYSVASGGSFVASASRVEAGSTDAKSAEVVWDTGSSVYRIVYSVGGEDIVVTRMDKTQGNVSHTTLVNGDSGDTYDQPVIAARASGGEYLAIFHVSDTGVPGRSLQAHFKR